MYDARALLTPKSQYRRYVDDAAALTRLNHGARSRLRDEKHALQVRIENRIPIGFGNVGDETLPRNAGIVHEHVRYEPLLVECSETRVDRRRLGDVEVHARRLAASAPDGFSRFL